MIIILRDFSIFIQDRKLTRANIKHVKQALRGREQLTLMQKYPFKKYMVR